MGLKLVIISSIGVFLLLNISFFSVEGLSINSYLNPPGLPDFYVNDDWIDLEDGTVVIDDFIIDYIIGDNAFAKIQDAINKASTHDKIFVMQGTYNENLLIVDQNNLDKYYLEIHGIYSWYDPDGNDPVLINGVSDEPVIKIQSNFVTIDGCTITKNDASGDGIVVDSLFCNIFQNTIENFKGTGLVLKNNASGTEAYNNNFKNNFCHAYDDSDEEAPTEWFKDKQGNYWDDHPGSLKRNSYVWLKPYPIQGHNEESYSEDKYPWINPDGKSCSKPVTSLYFFKFFRIWYFSFFLQ